MVFGGRNDWSYNGRGVGQNSTMVTEIENKMKTGGSDWLLKKAGQLLPLPLVTGSDTTVGSKAIGKPS